MKTGRLLSVSAACAVLLRAPRAAVALPTMIRLGYPNCSSCHISPQGSGLLNLYGHSIDKAQSLVSGEYAPFDDPWIRLLNWNGRISQDFRSVIQQQDTSTSGKAGTQLFRSRFIYRNATELGSGFRITATVTGENTSLLRPTLAYDPPVNAAQVFVNTALLSYRTGAVQNLPRDATSCRRELISRTFPSSSNPEIAWAITIRQRRPRCSGGASVT